ncbi:MAG: dihydrodipicolinate synthase family protein [Anaerolineae bacterium]|nr:dihydrodipicolinate synthase family protein [Anaerolineae bacterium]
MQTATVVARTELAQRMLGSPIPRLWCPPITHYSPGGNIAGERMAAHWRTMARYVGGFLVPGSTGDGWDMQEGEIAHVLAIATDLAVQLNTRVLVGVLRTDVEAMLDVIEATVTKLQAIAGESDVLAAMERCHVAGFTVCPPKGAALTQAEIQIGLEAVLDLGLPTAIYQLPQVTENEVSLAVFEDLAARYPNFLLFKDTSGEDHVPQEDRGTSGVFLVRGAEGSYASWLAEAGGCYQGLLLSTANCFAAEFARMISLLETGDIAGADALSQRISAVVAAAFDAVADVRHGNVFANANKAIDHFKAHGSGALSTAPPMLHAGARLPVSVIKIIGEALEAGGFMPATGYLEA